MARSNLTRSFSQFLLKSRVKGRFGVKSHAKADVENASLGFRFHNSLRFANSELIQVIIKSQSCAAIDQLTKLIRTQLHKRS